MPFLANLLRFWSIQTCLHPPNAIYLSFTVYCEWQVQWICVWPLQCSHRLTCIVLSVLAAGMIESVRQHCTIIKTWYLYKPALRPLSQGSGSKWNLLWWSITYLYYCESEFCCSSFPLKRSDYGHIRCCERVSDSVFIQKSLQLYPAWLLNEFSSRFNAFIYIPTQQIRICCCSSIRKCPHTVVAGQRTMVETLHTMVPEWNWLDPQEHSLKWSSRWIGTS